MMAGRSVVSDGSYSEIEKIYLILPTEPIMRKFFPVDNSTLLQEIVDTLLKIVLDQD